MQRTLQGTIKRNINLHHIYQIRRMTTEATASQTMRKGYKEWRAMGEGGTSPTWSGYMSSIAAEKIIAFDDTISPGIYRKPEKYALGWPQASPQQRTAAYSSFLRAPLPEREGPRARAKKFVFPQREKNADEPLDRNVKEAYSKAFDQLGQTNAPDTEWETSALEKHGTALFLKQKKQQPLTPLAAPTQREICHIHTSDWSGHVTLSFNDAEEVIAKGWGERHRLSGSSWIHLGYTMVYVPRSVEETAVLARIFQAGVDFMRSS